MDQFQELEEVLNEHFGPRSERNRSVPEDCENQYLVTDLIEETEIVSNNDIFIERARQMVNDIGVEETESVHCNSESSDQIECDIRMKYESGCGCSRNCLQLFSFDDIKQHILTIRELLKSEKEMLIMGALQESKSKTIKRARYEYTFKGHSICVQAVQILHDTNRFGLHSLHSHLQKNGYTPRVHGNTGKKPSNAFTFEEIKNATQYLLNYADKNGIPQPVGSRWQDASSPIYLPCGETKYSIHKMYISACEQIGIRPLGLSSFKDLWLKVLPHIKITTPRTDVCQKCEIFRKEIQDTVDDDDKIELINKFSEHLRRAQDGKERYKLAVSKSVQEFKDVVRGYGPIPPLSNNYVKVHYTFDFSQQMTVPHHARQMGPIYFVAPRKVQLFGVRMDGIPKRYNYLIDEDQTIGINGSETHGPNAVISMLHHALTNFSYGEQDCIFHADNCVGQNKNRFLMAYFSWRTYRKLHRQITYLMQIPGHTRCLVDANFAHIKKLYRRTDSECLEQLRYIVEKSSTANNAVMFEEEPTWIWRDWKQFLSLYYRQLKNIAKFYSFRFHADSPGIVYVRQNNEPETAIDIGKGDLPDALPQEIQLAGLSDERKKYLFRNVRQFVRDPFKDVTCPPISNSVKE